MLSKIRHYIDIKTRKSIHHAIYESHLSYTSLVWVQNSSSYKRLNFTQKKKQFTLFFLNRNAHTSPLFKNSEILKFSDKVALENCIFISKSLERLVHSIF